MAAQSFTTRIAPTCWEPLSRPRVTNLLSVTATAALVLSVWLLGRELAEIEHIADDMRAVVMPQMVAQQKYAIWIESLRSAASVVVFASEAQTRHDALAKAEQLAANVTFNERARHDVLAEATASIRLAAKKADESDLLDRQIREMLGQANALITDMSASLSSIVDDSASTLARVVREILQSHDQSRLSRVVLEEVLALNTTSQDLLASLDQGRILLAAARSTEVERELEEAARYFEAIGARLRARVHTLRGNTDYERLPGRIERFVQLAAIFDLRRQWLGARREAMAASDRAKASLAIVRENVAADAAAVAESSVATIAARASQSKLASAAAVVALIIGLGLVALRERWRGDPAAHEMPRLASARHRADREFLIQELAAALAAVERYHKAQSNLEHLRHALPAKLSRLLSLPGAQIGAPAGSQEAEPTGRPKQSDPPGQPDLPPLIDPLLDLVHEIAARASRSAQEGALTWTRLLQDANAGPEQGAADRSARHEQAKLIEAMRAIESAAVLTEITGERIGTAIGEMNIAAARPVSSEGATLGDAADGLRRRIDQLRADLALIHAQAGRLSAAAG